MTNQPRSIENLQKALSMELTATHQYLLHAHVLDDWGLETLAGKMREEMQEELGHAGKFIDRILFLDGDPKVSEQTSRTRGRPSPSTQRRLTRRATTATSAPAPCSRKSSWTRKAIWIG